MKLKWIHYPFMAWLVIISTSQVVAQSCNSPSHFLSQKVNACYAVCMKKSHVKMSGFQHSHPELVSCMTCLWEEEELIRVQTKALVLLEVFLSWCVCRGACHDVPSHRLPVGIPNIT